MGSLIHLALGNFGVDWGKNDRFVMHGALFQPGDVAQTPYTYWDSDIEGTVVEMKEGASRTLRRVLPRLALLGHTRETARAEFESLRDMSWNGIAITFDQLADALASFDPDAPLADDSDDNDFGEFFERETFPRLGLGAAVDGGRHPREIGQVLENMTAGSVLALAGLNPDNLSKPVTWQFADVVDGGWTDRDEIIGSLGNVRQFLIVTEGSSDARIIRHGLDLLRPDVADFFSFVDMEAGYPFTGTGSLHNFCKGLAAIRIENRVLVVYDNDAEGTARHRDTMGLNLPTNMTAVRLPALDRLASMATHGPDGAGRSDANGRAAAIECYLDLSYREPNEPVIRWTSFNHSAGAYQGELIGKERYARRFLKLDAIPADYESDGIEAVLDAIIEAAGRMATVT